MYLKPEQRGEYKEKMIDPFLTRKKNKELSRKNFEYYIKNLVEYVLRQIENLTGEDLNYEGTTSQQSTAIASIQKSGNKISSTPNVAAAMGFSLSQSQTLELSLEQELSFVMNIIQYVLNKIEIEECDDMETAYIGAYSVMLHEVGHHFDWEKIGHLTVFFETLKPDVVNPEFVKEIVCDRVGMLLGSMILDDKNPTEKKRLFWVSRLGLLHGFLVRYKNNLYSKDTSAVFNFLREKLEFELAEKIMAIGQDTRGSIVLALRDIDGYLYDLKNGNTILEDDISLLFKNMKLIYRGINKKNILESISKEVIEENEY